MQRKNFDPFFLFSPVQHVNCRKINGLFALCRSLCSGVVALAFAVYQGILCNAALDVTGNRFEWQLGEYIVIYHPPYFIVIASLVKILEAKVIKFHRIPQVETLP